MADKAYRVVKSDVKGMNEKIQKHRRKILRWIAFVTASVLIGADGVYIYLQTRTYTGYDVLK